jgi:hypothetical protein
VEAGVVHKDIVHTVQECMKVAHLMVAAAAAAVQHSAGSALTASGTPPSGTCCAVPQLHMPGPTTQAR